MEMMVENDGGNFGPAKNNVRETDDMTREELL